MKTQTERTKMNTQTDINHEGRVYRIIRFRFSGSNRTLRNFLTLSEAKAHCSRPDTYSHSTGPRSWFDGFDYMRGFQKGARI